jgi:hypothetical protein
MKTENKNNANMKMNSLMAFVTVPNFLDRIGMEGRQREDERR